MYPEASPVLVIDSEPRRRRLTERTLASEGFSVTAVPEGFSAIRAVESQRFAVVIAAVNLPGSLDGPTTVRQLRDRQPWLKALLIGDFDGRVWRPERDCDDFIPWPFHHRDLLGCVFELLQRDLGKRSRVG